MNRLFGRLHPPVTLIIPARIGSSRFPGKPLAMLRGVDGVAKPLIRRTWEAACRVEGIDRVLVATDDARIADVVARFGGEAIMTSTACRNGSERCAEAVTRAAVRDGVIVNLQGDAPLTPAAVTTALVEAMLADPGIAVTSAMVLCSPALAGRLIAAERDGAPAGATVVVDRRSDALYFSRHVLPWSNGDAGDAATFMHLGVYAYRTAALARYAATAPSAAEIAEGLEQLRFLDAGIRIRMVPLHAPVEGLWEVNHPGDIALVEAALRLRGLS